MAWLRRQYEKLAVDAERAGARFAILMLPYSNQVAGTATASVQEHVRDLGREHGWATIDLLPPFREAARSGERFFIDLWHFTPSGHRVAADAMLAQLCCQGLLPIDREDCCADGAGESPPAVRMPIRFSNLNGSESEEKQGCMAWSCRSRRGADPMG